MLMDAIAKKIAHSGGLGIAAPVFRQMIQMQEARNQRDTMTPDLLAATMRLADCLVAENAALRAMDLPGAAALLAEKQAAAAAFDIARQSGPPVASAAFRAGALRLMEQAAENRPLLKRAIHVQSRVLGVIAGAARATNPAPRYGRSGAYAAPRRPAGRYRPAHDGAAPA